MSTINLTKRKIFQINNSVSYLSTINQANGHPVFDIGLTASFAMAETISHLEAAINAIEKGKKAAAAAVKKLKDDHAALVKTIKNDDALTPDDRESKLTDASRAHETALQASDDAWEAMMDEVVEVKAEHISRFKLSEVKKAGQTIPPAFLIALRPLIVVDEPPAK